MLPDSSISDWLTGKTLPSPDRLQTFLTVCDVPSEAFPGLAGCSRRAEQLGCAQRISCDQSAPTAVAGQADGHRGKQFSMRFRACLDRCACRHQLSSGAHSTGNQCRRPGVARPNHRRAEQSRDRPIRPLPMTGPGLTSLRRRYPSARTRAARSKTLI